MEAWGAERLVAQGQEGEGTIVVFEQEARKTDACLVGPPHDLVSPLLLGSRVVDRTSVWLGSLPVA